MPTYFICFNNLIGSGPTAVNFVQIPFSIQKCQFLLLNPWLNAGGPLEICSILKGSILSSVVLRKYGIFSVSYISSLDFIDDLLDGKGNRVAISYFPSFFISISLIHNSWFTELTTWRYDKTKNLNSTKKIFKRKEPQTCKLVL